MVLLYVFCIEINGRKTFHVYIYIFSQLVLTNEKLKEKQKKL